LAEIIKISILAYPVSITIKQVTDTKCTTSVHNKARSVSDNLFNPADKPNSHYVNWKRESVYTAGGSPCDIDISAPS